MKTFFLYIIAILTLLSCGFIYLKLGHNAAQSLPQTIPGSPTITSGESGAQKLVFKNYGPAPEFPKNTQWLNSGPLVPLTIGQLTGKVVLVNFWTYSCITCIRSLPYLNQWVSTYQDQGLVVLGVHTPEYGFEKVTANVQNAISRYKISYPVAQDNSYAVWNSYNNQFWPATYLIDREGKIVYARFGEGSYDLIENAIRQLTSLPEGLAINPDAELRLDVKPSQKLAFGLKHKDSLANTEEASGQEQVYTLPETMRRNSLALEGVWKLNDEKASLTQGFGRIRLSFNALSVQLTAQSIKPVTITVRVDGSKKSTEISVQALRNYQLFSSDKPGRHTLDIEIPQAGFEATTFIFD